MEVIIRGEAKEIAALVAAVQGRQCETISIISDTTTDMDRTNLANMIRSILLETVSAENQLQQPDSTEHTHNQGEESQAEKPGS